MSNIKDTLIRVALEEAGKNYHGRSDSSYWNLQELADHFEGIDTEALNDDWSGAFVYRCAVLAGYALPARYPDPRVRDAFWRVEAWVDYANLPKIHLWRTDFDNLEPGDVVVFQPEEGRSPLMGVALDVGVDSLTVAVGNYRNHSAVIDRELADLAGFLTLKEPADPE